MQPVTGSSFSAIHRLSNPFSASTTPAAPTAPAIPTTPVPVMPATPVPVMPPTPVPVIPTPQTEMSNPENISLNSVGKFIIKIFDTQINKIQLNPILLGIIYLIKILPIKSLNISPHLILATLVRSIFLLKYGSYIGNNCDFKKSVRTQLLQRKINQELTKMVIKMMTKLKNRMLSWRR